MRFPLYSPGSSQTITHKTRIPIAALDISPQRTHAVIAGREILKTIRVTSDDCAEDFNIRSAIIGYSSTHVSTGAQSAKHKDQLAAKDVKWSHGEYDRIIATAAANGRIVIYDLTRAGVELGRFHEHNRQVHRLAFNPHRGAWLLSGSQDATIRMWDLRMVTGDRGAMSIGSKHHFSGHSEAVRDIRWSPADGVEFATATDSGAIQRWDVRKENAPLMKINAHEKPCFSVDWHPDGKHLVSGSTDRQVKVWDFSSTDRRQKPCFQFRTPQAVLNARWRPASWSSEVQDSGNWQSTQIVTSYDQEDPRIHLWDLRRPHVPYREFDYCNRSPSDMLWHSKDLLWSVNNEGIFTQTDIKFVPETVHRRGLCAVAWSPHGDVLAFASKRPKKRALSMNLGSTEFLGSRANNRSSGEKATSQSFSEETLDESAFASSLRKRPAARTAPYARGSKSLSGTPPTSSEDTPNVVSLDKAIASSGVFEPDQIGVVGQVPGATFDAAIFRYLAQHYAPLTLDPPKPTSSSLHPDALGALLNDFEVNAEHAENAALHRLAQTWRILKYAVSQELSTRPKRELQSAPTQQKPEGLMKKSSKDGSLLESSQNLEDVLPDKAKSRLFKGVIETERPAAAGGGGGARVTPDPESTSNMTTPLAQPLPDSPPAKDISGHRSDGLSLDNEEFDDIQPLPPSVLSETLETRGRETPSRSDLESFDASETGQNDSSDGQRATAITSPRSLSPDRLRDRDVSLQRLLDEGQRSAPRAIAGVASWRLQDIRNHDPRDLEDEYYENKTEEKKAALRDYKPFPKRTLSFEGPTQDSTNRPPAVSYGRHDSSESFPMFSASTDSSQRTKSISDGSAHAPLSGISQPEAAGWAPTTESPLARISELEIGSPPRSTRERDVPEPVDELSMEEASVGSSTVHLDRPSSPLPFIAESYLNRPQAQIWKNDNKLSVQTNGDVGHNSESIHDLVSSHVALSPDVAHGKPWSFHNLIREAIKYYCSSAPVDIQSAAHLLHKMHTVFYSCEKILPYEEREFIFRMYNEQLLRQRMFVEAAELRLLCVPSYPSVYDYAQQDTFINVFCFECKKPYENPTRDNKRCHRCDIAQPPCAICLSRDPPLEWVLQLSDFYDPSTSTSMSSSTTVPFSFTQGSFSDSGSDTSVETSAKSSIGGPPSNATDEDDTLLSAPTMPRPRGAALWSWCQGCGHGAHTACQAIWLNDLSMSEGGCATPGCFHDCGPGPRRDQNRIALVEQARRNRYIGYNRKSNLPFAKRDYWAAGESKAVERVRGMLGLAAGANSGQTSTSGASQASASSSNTVLSPKKVRLVTPSEQGGDGKGRLTGPAGARDANQQGSKESFSDLMATDRST